MTSKLNNIFYFIWIIDIFCTFEVMKNSYLYLFIFFSFFSKAQELPPGFVYLDQLAPTIEVELRYFSTNNFIGKPIDGYQRNCLITSLPAAKAIIKIQNKLKDKEYRLKIFDGYRPQQAVVHFMRWAALLNDTLMKAEYYPNTSKSELFNQGYIASKSGHSRGSTIDLTLVDTKTQLELDMGSSYDFFGAQSHPFYPNISKKQLENRMFLRAIMVANGFKPFKNEWWHFTLINEPFPKTYFNFPIN
jgi:D-alanyl-D-alanine dipeptidase